ncbi:MAG: thioesterase family protein [Myxococcota bacterium]
MFASLPSRWLDTPRGPVFDVPEGWGQGRATFGGLVGAAGVALARRATPRTLRVLQAQLLAPVTPGPLHGSVEVLREGRTTTIVQVQLRQRDRLAAHLGLTYAVPRPGSKTVAGPEAPAWGPPDQHPAIPYLAGLTPEFMQQVECRWIEGGLPYSGAAEPRLGGYVRFHTDEPPSLEAIVALLDVFPTPTLVTLDRPVPSSSVTWTAHFHAAPRPGPYAFRYETVAATDGLSSVVGHLWAADGTPLAFTEQAIAVFDG